MLQSLYGPKREPDTLSPKDLRGIIRTSFVRSATTTTPVEGFKSIILKRTLKVHSKIGDFLSLYN